MIVKKCNGEWRTRNLQMIAVQSSAIIRLIASLLHLDVTVPNISPDVSCCLATTLKLNLWMRSQWKSCLCLTSCLGNGAPPKKLMKVTHMARQWCTSEKLMKATHLTHYGLETACTHAVVTYDRGHKMVISCPLGMIRFKSCSPPLWTWHN